MTIEQSNQATQKVYEVMEANKMTCFPFKDEFCLIDGIITKQGKVVGLYELKVRDISHHELESTFDNSLLISKNKIETGMRIAQLCSSKFVILLHTLKDARTFIKTITDEKGDLVCSFEEHQTKTKKNIEGGQAIRDNYFIKMNNLYEVK
jgi:hypothetical protein